MKFTLATPGTTYAMKMDILKVSSEINSDYQKTYREALEGFERSGGGWGAGRFDPPKDERYDKLNEFIANYHTNNFNP